VVEYYCIGHFIPEKYKLELPSKSEYIKLDKTGTALMHIKCRLGHFTRIMDMLNLNSIGNIKSLYTKNVFGRRRSFSL